MTRLALALVGAVRRLLRSPVSAAGIVLTLTLGSAVSVSMFSVLHGVALQGLPYADAERIVSIYSQNLELGTRRSFTAAEAVEGLIDVPGFEYTAYYNTPLFTVDGYDGPLRVQIANVSEDYFSVFGVEAELGRTLNAGDFAEGRPVVVLSHSAWVALTGGDSNVIGRALAIRTTDASQAFQLEVVGVLPESFTHPRSGALLYRPWDAAAPISSSNLRIVSVVGKLAAGASGFAAEGLHAHITAVQEAHGLLERGWQASYSTLVDELLGDARTVLWALFGVSLLVLLIACSSASSLISIRLEQRETDFSVRRALGASRGRIALDVALELILLAGLGALGGVVLAHAIVAAVQPLAAGILPRAANIEIGRAALVFAAAVTVVSVWLSGIAPLLRTLRTDSAERLKGGTRHEVRSGGPIALPSAGIGLATIALVAALALAQSLARLGSVELGFRVENVVALEVTRSQSIEQVGTFLDRVIEVLATVPGVQNVAATVGSPPSQAFSGWTPMEFTVRGQKPFEHVLANVRSASPGYHRLLEIPLLRGRDISARDSTSAPRVVVINETLARQAFGDTDPIGQVLMVGMGGSQPGPLEIVGVVGDTRNAGLRAPIQPEMTFPMRQYPMPSVTLLVKSSLLPPNWRRTLEEAVRRVDPDQAVARSYLIADDLSMQTRRDRLFVAATGWFAVLALLLAVFGVNAVIAAMQRRRTREIGLRLALGASPRQASALVLGIAGRMILLGLAGGMSLAVPALGALRHLFFGMEAGAFWELFGLTALVLITFGMGAAAWPAWRASRTAAMEALRYE